VCGTAAISIPRVIDRIWGWSERIFELVSMSMKNKIKMQNVSINKFSSIRIHSFKYVNQVLHLLLDNYTMLCYTYYDVSIVTNKNDGFLT